MNVKIGFEAKLNEGALIEIAKEALWRTVHKAEELAVLNCPVDRATLKNSIHISPLRKGELEYLLADGVEYGIYVEYGTSPHKVPIQPLKGWAKRKLNDENLAWAIAAKIRKEGTPAQPFLRPAALLAVNVFFPMIVRDVMNEFQSGV